jgi:hypothetical protein
MRDSMEMMLFRQFFGGGDSWTHAVFLAGVFLAVLFRRDQIVSPYMFRVSIIMFVLAIILPVAMTMIFQISMNGGSRGMLSSGAGPVLSLLMMVLGPVLFGLAVLFCVLSMLPQVSRYPGPPSRPPQPHPLD